VDLSVPDFDNGHWLFPEKMGEGVGFIYVVRDNYLEKFYLGKKFFHGHGKLNKGMESNWRKYVSSSNLLKTMFGERPKEEFDFVCLEQYEMKGALSYAETWTLCLVEAPTTEDWYNTRVEKVSWRVRERITERHKERLERVMMMDGFEEER